MLLVAAFLLLQSANPQVIDRLVAVVGNDPIFLSDVRDVTRLSLFDPAGMLASISETDGATEEERALQRLINRRLVLAEVARYSQLPPAEADVARAMTAWQERAGTPPPAHDAAAVRAFLIETIRIDGYIEQRFGATTRQARVDAVRDWLRGLRERAAIRILR